MSRVGEKRRKLGVDERLDRYEPQIDEQGRKSRAGSKSPREEESGRCAWTKNDIGNSASNRAHSYNEINARHHKERCAGSSTTK